MNITAILLKKVILEEDSETWAKLRKHYLPTEYSGVYKFINTHFESHSSLPSFDALKLSIRSDSLLNKIYAIEQATDVDIDNDELLEYLKNEYTQEEIMDKISSYLDESIMMDSAKQSLENLQQIVLDIEDKVDIKSFGESMRTIELFDPPEVLENAFALGLNEEYDKAIKFFKGEYILIGGKRGAGKSVVCANVAGNTYQSGNSAMYFTIEMPQRPTIQRICAINNNISYGKLKRADLGISDWTKVAEWWAARFEGGGEAILKYKEHHNFSTLHQELARCNLGETQLEVIYDPVMTLSNIRSELDKKVAKLNPSVVIVDYVNQVKRAAERPGGQYDWAEQVEVSKALKAMAQEYEVPFVSPYQIDASGEARFSKGILDSADAAFAINPHSKEDGCMTFECAKMRDNEEVDFTSAMNWSTLKLGPESALVPGQQESTGEDAEDL